MAADATHDSFFSYLSNGGNMIFFVIGRDWLHCFKWQSNSAEFSSFHESSGTQLLHESYSCGRLCHPGLW